MVLVFFFSSLNHTSNSLATIPSTLATIYLSIYLSVSLFFYLSNILAFKTINLI